jgi:hypothetical protein
MKLKELNLEISKLIYEGFAEAEVYVDTEARTYEAHLIPIQSINSDEGLVDGINHVFITITD